MSILRIAALVPVHKFTMLVPDICRWCEANYPSLFDAYRIFLVCDDPESAQALQDLSGGNIIVETSHTPNSLKWSLIRGTELAKQFGADVINVIEADAVPRDSTLAAMTTAFRELPLTGAISPLYDWQGEIAYPVHPHWFTDELFAANHPGLGEIRSVGDCGIPFLFTLWMPAALDVISEFASELPEVHRLDGRVGGLVIQKGLRFYRLMNHAVGHYNGGRNG